MIDEVGSHGVRAYSWPRTHSRLSIARLRLTHELVSHTLTTYL
jgi:hypothetical protein